MEIRIGIMNSARELSFETEQKPAEISAAVESALGSSGAVVTFTDTKGNTYVVPANSLAYVEIGSQESRPVGFVG